MTWETKMFELVFLILLFLLATGILILVIFCSPPIIEKEAYELENGVICEDHIANVKYIDCSDGNEYLNPSNVKIIKSMEDLK